MKVMTMIEIDDYAFVYDNAYHMDVRMVTSDDDDMFCLFVADEMIMKKFLEKTFDNPEEHDIIPLYHH